MTTTYFELWVLLWKHTSSLDCFYDNNIHWTTTTTYTAQWQQNTLNYDNKILWIIINAMIITYFEQEVLQSQHLFSVIPSSIRTQEGYNSTKKLA